MTIDRETILMATVSATISSAATMTRLLQVVAGSLGPQIVAAFRKLGPRPII
jgi:hypothetical protein